MLFFLSFLYFPDKGKRDIMSHQKRDKMSHKVILSHFRGKPDKGRSVMNPPCREKFPRPPWFRICHMPGAS